MMDTVGINEFARRHTAESRFSHYRFGWVSLLLMTEKNLNEALANGTIVEGDRKGVIKLPLPPEGFFTSLVTLTPETVLKTRYEPRREGEAPVKTTVAVNGNKLPAKSVEIILYSHELLAENNEHSTEADWEIVSINASPDENGTPITPGALMRNFFGEAGGTKGTMTDLEFVEQLRISREFWRDKVMYEPQGEG